MVDGRNLEERACDGRTGLCWNEGFRYRERHYDGSAQAWAGGSGRISRDLLIRPEDPRCQNEGDRDAGGYCSQWSLVWIFPPAFAVWVYLVYAYPLWSAQLLRLLIYSTIFHGC
jgi:hypothetical protein